MVTSRDGGERLLCAPGRERSGRTRATAAASDVVAGIIMRARGGRVCSSARVVAMCFSERRKSVRLGRKGPGRNVAPCVAGGMVDELGVELGESGGTRDSRGRQFFVVVGYTHEFLGGKPHLSPPEYDSGARAYIMSARHVFAACRGSRYKVAVECSMSCWVVYEREHDRRCRRSGGRTNGRTDEVAYCAGLSPAGEERRRDFDDSVEWPLG